LALPVKATRRRYCNTESSEFFDIGGPDGPILPLKRESKLPGDEPFMKLMVLWKRFERNDKWEKRLELFEQLVVSGN
jgi:hypothetical protein